MAKLPRKIITAEPMGEVKIDRVTVLMTLHHTQHGEPTVTASNSYDFECECHEQMFVRKMNITGVDPTPLDYGWIAEPGLVCILNKSDTESLLVDGKYVVFPGRHFLAQSLEPIKVSLLPDQTKPVSIHLYATPS